MNITKKDAATLLIEISGLINGESMLPKIDPKGIKVVVFNFDKVEAINSIGVKQWIAYLQEIPPSIQVRYTFARRVVVDQMNMITHFRPSYVTVESFYVPYVCTKCNSVISILYEQGKHFERGGKLMHPTEVLCGSCFSPVEIDVIPEKYFHFLSKR